MIGRSVDHGTSKRKDVDSYGSVLFQDLGAIGSRRSRRKYIVNEQYVLTGDQFWASDFESVSHSELAGLHIHSNAMCRRVVRSRKAPGVHGDAAKGRYRSSDHLGLIETPLKRTAA